MVFSNALEAGRKPRAARRSAVRFEELYDGFTHGNRNTFAKPSGPDDAINLGKNLVLP
jgi:hypothetical protein